MLTTQPITAKSIKAMQQREAYIQSAKIKLLKGDLALVKSEHSNSTYTVPFLRYEQIALDCECADHQKRHHICKHMEAVERKLRQRKTRKVSPLVAELQLPEGSKVRLTKGVLKVSAIVPDSAIKVTSECLPTVDDEILTDEDEALFQQIGEDEIVLADELMVEGDRDLPEEDRRYIVPGVHPLVYDDGDGRSIYPTQKKIEEAPLNGNRGFNLLRV